MTINTTKHDSWVQNKLVLVKGYVFNIFSGNGILGPWRAPGGALTSCGPISILGLAEEFMLGRDLWFYPGNFLKGVCGYANESLSAQSGGEMMAMMI